MTSGNQFRFLACLALVRFRGPHVGAGTSGGIASVQAAIRTATHILAVPTNPTDPIEHTNNTEALKAACIETLESLGGRHRLWSAISKDALPSIVNYLHSASRSRRRQGQDDTMWSSSSYCSNLWGFSLMLFPRLGPVLQFRLVAFSSGERNEWR
jgi:hypothetical protein